MQFNSRNIMLLLIVVTFNLQQTPFINEEKEMKEKIENMFQKIYENKFKIEKEPLDFLNSFDMSKAIIEEEGIKRMICVNNV